MDLLSKAARDHVESVAQQVRQRQQTPDQQDHQLEADVAIPQQSQHLGTNDTNNPPVTLYEFDSDEGDIDVKVEVDKDERKNSETTRNTIWVSNRSYRGSPSSPSTRAVNFNLDNSSSAVHVAAHQRGLNRTVADDDTDKDGNYQNVDPDSNNTHRRNDYDNRRGSATSSLGVNSARASESYTVSTTPRGLPSRTSTIVSRRMGEDYDEIDDVLIKRVPLSTLADFGFWLIGVLLFISVIFLFSIQVSGSYNSDLLMDLPWSTVKNTTHTVAFSLNAMATETLNPSVRNGVRYDADSACMMFNESEQDADSICNACGSAGETAYGIQLIAVSAAMIGFASLTVSAHSKNDVALGMRHTTFIHVIALCASIASVVIWDRDCHQKLNEVHEYGNGFTLTLVSMGVQVIALLLMVVWCYFVRLDHTASEGNIVHWPYVFDYGPNKCWCGVTIPGWFISGIAGWLTVATLVASILLLIPLSSNLRVLSAVNYGVIEGASNATELQHKIYFGLGGFGLFDEDNSQHVEFPFPVDANDFCERATSTSGFEAGQRNCVSYEGCQLCTQSNRRTVMIVAGSVAVSGLHVLHAFWRHCHCKHALDLDTARMVSAALMIIGASLTTAAIFRLEYDCLRMIKRNDQDDMDDGCDESDSKVVRGDAFGGLCVLLVLQLMIAVVEISVGYRDYHEFHPQPTYKVYSNQPRQSRRSRELRSYRTDAETFARASAVNRTTTI
eukprot:m.117879 g.117879  ORF g.117879 m.117879 type:complete len:727 (-) comp28614_c1_seq1:492-2672(-)